jgi:hypothetical protein
MALLSFSYCSCERNSWMQGCEYNPILTVTFCDYRVKTNVRVIL